jgi:hypothetical protein
LLVVEEFPKASRDNRDHTTMTVKTPAYAGLVPGTIGFTDYTQRAMA